MPILIQNVVYVFTSCRESRKGHTSGLTKEINKLRGEKLDIII